MSAPLPHDHPGLPESYVPSDNLLPSRWPTLKDWAIAAAVTMATVVILALVFTIADLLPLALDVHAMVNAATDGAQVCRIDTINGIRIEHCVRTIYKF